MDLQFAIFYSLGGAVIMPFLEPLTWLPAIIIDRNGPRKVRFWLELLIGAAIAILIAWWENNFASMDGLNSTVVAIQFIRPSVAELLAALVANWLWKIGRRAVATYKIQNAIDA